MSRTKKMSVKWCLQRQTCSQTYQHVRCPSQLKTVNFIELSPCFAFMTFEIWRQSYMTRSHGLYLLKILIYKQELIHMLLHTSLYTWYLKRMFKSEFFFTYYGCLYTSEGIYFHVDILNLKRYSDFPVSLSIHTSRKCPITISFWK